MPRLAAQTAASAVETERRDLIGHSRIPVPLSSLNRQVEDVEGKSKLTQGTEDKPAGDSGVPCSASSFGLAQTTVRIMPTRVATMLLSGNAPIRAATSM